MKKEIVICDICGKNIILEAKRNVMILKSDYEIKYDADICLSCFKMLESNIKSKKKIDISTGEPNYNA